MLMGTHKNGLCGTVSFVSSCVFDTALSLSTFARTLKDKTYKTTGHLNTQCACCGDSKLFVYKNTPVHES